MFNQETHDPIITCVYQTTDYAKFKRLEGNREVLEARKSRIRKSIELNGYIPVPIIVNEKLEVLDGQGRLEICKEKNLPIFYLILKDAPSNVCTILNSTTTPWSLMDYINYYADNGNEDYINLRSVIEKFPSVSIAPILAVVCNIYTHSDSAANTKIRQGLFKFPASQMQPVIRTLGYVEKFLSYWRSGDGMKASFVSAVTFCANTPEIDIDRLLDKFSDLHHSNSTFNKAYSIRDALSWLENVYNFKAGAKNIRHICTLYDDHCRTVRFKNLSKQP